MSSRVGRGSLGEPVGASLAESDASVGEPSDSGSDFDERLASARAAYSKRAVEHAAELRAALALLRQEPSDAAIAHARAIAHRFCGTSGTYGLDVISAAAGAIEVALVAMADRRITQTDAWTQIEAALSRLP